MSVNSKPSHSHIFINASSCCLYRDVVCVTVCGEIWEYVPDVDTHCLRHPLSDSKSYITFILSKLVWSMMCHSLWPCLNLLLPCWESRRLANISGSHSIHTGWYFIYFHQAVNCWYIKIVIHWFYLPARSHDFFGWLCILIYVYTGILRISVPWSLIVIEVYRIF